MEANEKYDKELKEVVYIPSDQEKNGSQLLHLEDEERSGDGIFLYFSAFTADLVVFASGCGIGWSSPALEKLKQIDPSINPLGKPVTSMEESWIAALICLGAAVGPIMASKSADTLGRKKTLILLALPMIAANISLAFASNLMMFYVARFVLGLGLGSSFAVLPTYLAEITENHNRGKFGCIMAVFITLGLLYPFLVGPFLSLKLFSFSCAIPLMLFLIFFTLFVPDSPVFLIVKGNKKQGKEALMLLRNKSARSVEKEFLTMVEELEKVKNDKGGIGDLFKAPNLRKGLVVSVGLVILQQFGGINAVLGFMGQIFDASGSGLSTYTSTVLVGSIQVIATIITSATVEKLGRKFLLLVSAVGSCTALLILGLYFYLNQSKIYNVDNLFWLPVVCLIVYIVTFNMGLGPMPWTVMGEIFPSNVKSVSAAITVFSCFFASFVVTLGFPILAEWTGMAHCFWLFGFCCVLGIVFIYFVVPETKGRTTAEIQEILSGGKSRN